MVRPKKNSQRPIVSVVETGEVIVDPTKSCPKVLLERVPIPPNGTVKLESKQETSFTPRISARLQKKGKFSVRKLLGGLTSSPPSSPTPVRKKKRRSKKSSSPPKVSPNTNSGEEVVVYENKEKLNTDEDDLVIKKKDKSEYLFGPEITISPIVKNSTKSTKSGDDDPDDVITISEGNTGRSKVFTSSTKPSHSTPSKFDKVNKVQPRFSESKEKRPVNLNLLKLQDNKEISVSFINKNTSSEKKNVPLSDSVVVQSSTKVKKYYELKTGTSSGITKEKFVEPSKKPQLRPKELQSDSIENLLGKKTAKVTPLTQEKNDKENLRSDASKMPDKIEAKSPKSNLKSSPTSTKTDSRLKSHGKRRAEQAFEKFFITKQSVCEHNESLDSDSEEEIVRIDKNTDDDITVVEVEESSKLVAEEEKETSSIYDLMQNISMELPAWNLHILEDTNSFCIANVVRGPVGIPVMKKIIEIDVDYNAKVFINQAFRSEFRGVYDSYESIQDLIYSVDRIT